MIILSSTEKYAASLRASPGCFAFLPWILRLASSSWEVKWWLVMDKPRNYYLDFPPPCWQILGSLSETITTLLSWFTKPTWFWRRSEKVCCCAFWRTAPHRQCHQAGILSSRFAPCRHAQIAEEAAPGNVPRCGSSAFQTVKLLSSCWHGLGLGQVQLSWAIAGRSSGVNSGQRPFPKGVWGGKED